MKIRYAAALSGLSLLVAGLYAVIVTSQGMRIAGDQTLRLMWLDGNTGFWSIGIWLWLLAVFGWMVLLATMSWSYLPGFRVSAMLQSGLMVISAVLAIVGLVTWMGTLPYAASIDLDGTFVPLVDTFVMGMFGAALFMGGAVTAWIAFDLAQIETLKYAWVLPAIVAGLLAIPAPFVLPSPWLPILAGILWLVWCAFLFSRSEMPNAFAEMK